MTQLKQHTRRITQSTQRSYRISKEETRFYNWLARLRAFVMFKKLVYPAPPKADINKFMALKPSQR